MAIQASESGHPWRDPRVRCLARARGDCLRAGPEAPAAGGGSASGSRPRRTACIWSVWFRSGC